MIFRNIALSILITSYYTMLHAMTPSPLQHLRTNATRLFVCIDHQQIRRISSTNATTQAIEQQKEYVKLLEDIVDEHKEISHKNVVATMKLTTLVSGLSIGSGVVAGLWATAFLDMAHSINNPVLAVPVFAASGATALGCYALIGAGTIAVPAGIQFARLCRRDLKAARLELRTEREKLIDLQRSTLRANRP